MQKHRDDAIVDVFGTVADSAKKCVKARRTDFQEEKKQYATVTSALREGMFTLTAALKTRTIFET